MHAKRYLPRTFNWQNHAGQNITLNLIILSISVSVNFNICLTTDSLHGKSTCDQQNVCLHVTHTAC